MKVWKQLLQYQIANLEILKKAVKNAEEKLSDLMEAVRELEEIELEIG